jgi:hypothetical protein
MLLAFIGGRRIDIPKPPFTPPVIPPWLQRPRPSGYSILFMLALPKVCRLCGAAITPGQRFCTARCRLEASGREDLVQKADSQHGWSFVERTTTRRT